MSDDTIVYLADLRAAGVCWRGSRIFLLRHGLDPEDFRRNGIAASKLLKTNDAIAARVVGVAHGRR